MNRPFSPAHAAACALALCPAIASAVTPPGIVFESEAISQPADGWLRDRSAPDRWRLWTKEEDIERKRSGGAVLATPPVKVDRASPEEGAPPLHGVVRGLKPGTYQIYVSAPNRPLAYSLDGKEWQRYSGGELNLGRRILGAAPFEIWIDDRYAAPENSPGSAYYDYVRFLPVPESTGNIRRAEAYGGLARWLHDGGRGAAVFIGDLELSGFVREANGGRLRGEKIGDSFSYRIASPGRYWPALTMNDSAALMEELAVDVNGREVARIAATGVEDEPILFHFGEPLELVAGDRLRFTCRSAGLCRIDGLALATAPIEVPAPKCEHLAAWSDAPGSVDLCWITSRFMETGHVEYGIDDLSQSTEANPYRGRNHRVRLENLQSAKRYQARVVTRYEGREILSPTIRFQAAPPTPTATAPDEIPLTIAEPTGAPRAAWPATIGLPFARGRLARVGDLRLFDPRGEPVQLQADLFARWPDGSVKWAMLSFLADTGPGPITYRLRSRPEWPEKPPRAVPLLEISETPGAWRLVAAGETIEIDRRASHPLRGLDVVDGRGAKLTCGPADPASFAVECNGPVRAVVKWAGPLLGPEGPAGWSYLVRLELRGSLLQGWDLSVSSDEGPRTFRTLRSITALGPRGKGAIRASLGDAPPQPVAGEGLSLLQDRDDHFTLRTPQETRQGARAVGLAVLEGEGGRAIVHVPEFWESYPNGLSVGPGGVRVDLLPALPADAYGDPASRKHFSKLYAWCDGGLYRIAGGQLIRRQIWLSREPEARPRQVAEWIAQPLLPRAAAGYLCGTGVLGRPIFPRTPGLWESYEGYYERSFEKSLADRVAHRTYGWMHHGDWFGERVLNYGNSEYDMGWSTAVQWMRGGDRRLFLRGLEMVRHNTSVDTVHGPAAADLNGLVYEHSFNHVGTPLKPEQLLALNPGDRSVAAYLKLYGNSMLTGAIDRQGHIFQEGNWMYAALTGDRFLRDVAERVCANQAERLTPRFDFSIERTAAWPLTNAVAAYRFTSNPYYLNAARLMIQRVLERQDPATGGWPHWPPLSETDEVPTFGGKAFAVGVLSYGILRYLDEEPIDRPDVRAMVARGSDWLQNESWIPGKGFRYITNCAKYRDVGAMGATCLMNAELVAAAYEFTRDERHARFWKEMVGKMLEGDTGGNGKGFTQGTRQTVFGLDRAATLGIARGGETGSSPGAR